MFIFPKEEKGIKSIGKNLAAEYEEVVELII